MILWPTGQELETEWQILIWVGRSRQSRLHHDEPLLVRILSEKLFWHALSPKETNETPNASHIAVFSVLRLCSTVATSKQVLFVAQTTLFRFCYLVKQATTTWCFMLVWSLASMDVAWPKLVHHLIIRSRCADSKVADQVSSIRPIGITLLTLLLVLVQSWSPSFLKGQQMNLQPMYVA